jgi:hypothetical protein
MHRNWHPQKDMIHAQGCANLDMSRNAATGPNLKLFKPEAVVPGIVYEETTGLRRRLSIYTPEEWLAIPATQRPAGRVDESGRYVISQSGPLS